jgi:predicted nucleic acid-binding protein
MEINKPVIADSSGIISLVIGSDSNNKYATDIATKMEDRKYTALIPTEVFAETINILGKKFGHEQAYFVIDHLLASTAFRVIPSTDLIRRDALFTFRTMATSVSYTDCLVMALADYHATKTIFGFDEIFIRQGYRLPSLN